MNGFDSKVRQHTGGRLTARDFQTLQVNVGLRCNQRCTHCHVDASPDRKALMGWRTMKLVIEIARKARPKLVDITGGSPEMNPYLRRLVKALRGDGQNVQVRTNLTVLLEPGMEDMIKFYKDCGVRLVASFPCYRRPEVDNVRGEGVFEKSLEALRQLNASGYGKDPGLVLDLVFNPEGDFLPAAQAELEAEFRLELGRLGIAFNSLLAITNMPVGRFRRLLRRNKKEEGYMHLLRRTFNPQTLDRLMCLGQIDVGWDGTVYDCDFNLALRLPSKLPSVSRRRSNIGLFDPAKHAGRVIATGEHCFGCTAGAGSSCGGALEK